MAVKTTYRGLLELIQRFADNHNQVKYFQVGSPFDMDWAKKTDGVILFALLERSSVREGYETFSMRVLIMDLLSTGKELIEGERQNGEDVINDCLLIADDLLATLDKINYEVEDIINLSYAVALTKNSIQRNAFYQRFENLYAGVDMTFDMQVPYDFDFCSIPFISSSPIPVSPCLPVSILNLETGALIASVPSGGTYEVLVFSGIEDDGGPYSNSIVNP